MPGNVGSGVAQQVERLPPTPGIGNSNPVISKFYLCNINCIESVSKRRKQRKKVSGMVHLKNNFTLSGAGLASLGLPLRH